MPRSIRAGSLRIAPWLIDLNRDVAGGHVLGDHELVEHVGLIVDAAIERAGDRPHQIPQQWLLPRRGDLGSPPGAQCLESK
jgi:hypothetical protein